MKAKKLLDILSKVDPEMDVLCSVEGLDEEIAEGQLLDVVSGDVVKAKKDRLVDGKPVLEYSSADGSIPHLILELTPNF